MMLINKKINLLFAGHDFKFANIIIDYFRELPNFEVKLDLWLSHNEHNEEHSLKCLNWANVIVCEWGLGNAVWYSNHKKENQVLIIRMHRQELDTSYYERFNMGNIGKIITIAPHTLRSFKERLRLSDKTADIKMSLIYNAVDSDKFAIKKQDDAKFNLGMVGYCPKLKRLDRSLDIFESLWIRDKRYTLYLKGKAPMDYGWLWRREEERVYYESIFKRIQESEWKNNVIFEPWGDDVAEWFKKIGFILSVSDYEGSHVSVAEGMASGSIPIILNWKGSKEIYPEQFNFNTIQEAAGYIDFIANSNDLDFLRCKAIEYITGICDKKIICNQWRLLIESKLEGKF
jgi:hypothetical protein